VLFAMYVACNPSIEKQCIPLSLKMVIEKWSSELWFEETDCWTRDHVIIAKQAWSNKSIEKKCIPLSLKMVIEKWSSELWFEGADWLRSTSVIFEVKWATVVREAKLPRVCQSQFNFNGMHWNWFFFIFVSILL
jgi:hypothetical protein